MSIREKVFKHLHEVGNISRLEALGLYNCFDITTVVRDLKRGTNDRPPIDIQTELKQDRNGKTYARYNLCN